MSGGMEIRAAAFESSGDTLYGYAARFETPAKIGGRFTEVISRSAFDRSLASGKNIRALYEHDPQKLLASTQAGTLKLSTDDIGLRFELTLPETDYARNLRSLVARGDVSECSFGFRVPQGGGVWEKRDVFRLNDVDLMEVTCTANPAYSGTACRIRSDIYPELDRKGLLVYLETL